MKCVIAGSRENNNIELVREAIKQSCFKITEVVSGGATGIDKCGEKWAKENDIPVTVFKADWKNLKAKGAVVKKGKFGEYNAKAGTDRNKEMAKYADALIAIKENTPGTADMIKQAQNANLKVYIYEVKTESHYEF